MGLSWHFGDMIYPLWRRIGNFQRAVTARRRRDANWPETPILWPHKMVVRGGTAERKRNREWRKTLVTTSVEATVLACRESCRLQRRNQTGLSPATVMPALGASSTNGLKSPRFPRSASNFFCRATRHSCQGPRQERFWWWHPLWPVAEPISRLQPYGGQVYLRNPEKSDR